MVNLNKKMKICIERSDRMGRYDFNFTYHPRDKRKNPKASIDVVASKKLKNM